MALFATPFDDIFQAMHGHMLHRHPHRHHRPSSGRGQRGHVRGVARHLDPFLNAVFDAAFDDRMDTEDDAADVFEPEVVENDCGYLITARVPGVAAKDIVVNLRPGVNDNGDRVRDDDVLTVRSSTHPHVRADLRLPATTASLVSVADIAASCIDGILRIAVPKMTPTSTAIVVADPSTATADADGTNDDDDMNEDGAQARTIVIQVPGFARDDITVTRKRPAEALLVTGKSKRRGGAGFRREYRLTDPRSKVTATCADGLLTIRVVTPTVAPFQVPVSADRTLQLPTSAAAAPAADIHAAADDNTAENITVMRRAVPGATAADFKVEVTPEGYLKASADCAVSELGRRRFQFAVSLPNGVDRSTVRANVVDGVLAVTAAAPVPPTPVAVEVSGDRLAALPAGLADAAVAALEAAEAAAADMEAEEQ